MVAQLAGDGFRPSGRQVDAMQAIFDLEAAMRGDMSILEVKQVVRLAVAGGHEQLMVALWMALQAVAMACDEVGGPGSATLRGLETAREDLAAPEGERPKGGA